MAGEGSNVGNIFARLGFSLDQSGSQQWEALRRKAEGESKTPINQPLGADVDDAAFREYHRKLDEVRARAKRKEDFKAKLGADYDPKAFTAYQRDLDRAARAARQFSASNDQTTKSFNMQRASAEALGGTLRKLFKESAVIAGGGIAVQGASAGIGGIGALAAGLAPLTGALAAYPALASAAGQGLGVFKLATDNIFKAVGGVNERLDKSTKAFKALTPEAKKVAVQLDEMKKPLRDLSGVAQKNLFPGLFEGLKDAEKNLPVLRGIVADTGKALGDLAKQAGTLAGSKSFGRDLATQGARNATTIERLGSAALHVGDALRHVVLAAGPLVDWMTKSALSFSKLIDQQAKAGRESGALAGFFEKTRHAMSDVAHIAGDVATALFNIGKQAYPLGNDLLDSLTKNADTFRKWTESARGQNSIVKYFHDIRPAVYEAGELVRDIAKTFFKLGQGEQVAPLLHTVRTKLLPVFAELVDNTTKAFGPALLDLVTQAALLFGKLGGSTGPLVMFAKLMAGILTTLNNLIDRVPALGTAVAALVTLGGIAKVLGIASSITGVGKLIGLLRTARGVAAGTAVAEGAAGVGAARGGAVAAGALGGPVGIGITAAALIGLQGLDNKTKRNVQAQATANTFGSQFAGSDPAQIARIGRAMDVLTGKTSATSAQWEKYKKVLERVGITSDASRQDVQAVGERFDKLRGPVERAATAIRNFFGRKTRISAADILDPNAADQVKSELEHIRRYGVASIDDLRDRLKFNVREISKAFREGSTGWRGAMIDNFSAGITAVKRAMRDGTISTKDGMAEIRKITRQQMGFTRDNMKNLSADGKQQLALNFRKAADAARDQMTRSGKVTKSGMETIRGYLTQELRLYGFSISQAKNIAATGDPDANKGREGGAFRQQGGFVKRARGGWIGGKGMVGDDTVQVGPNAVAAPGEFHAVGRGTDAIINRHQAPLANLFMLASGGPFQSLDDLASRGRGVDQVGYLDSVMAPMGGLAGLFSSIQRPHMMQEGGLFDRARKFAYGGVTGPLSSLIGRLDAMGFHHGSTTGGGHAPNSYHYKGEAVDYGNASNNLARLWSVVFPMRGRFAELFGPPGLFHFGSRFSDPALQAQHNDHIHMALTGAAGALGAPKQIRAPRIRGGGAVGKAVQAALGLAASGANRVVQRATAVGSFDSAESGGGGLSGSAAQNMALGRRMAAARGWTGSLWNALRSLWTRESGWDASARNPSSGAAGIPQDITGNFHGGARGQIAWGLNYIAGRYGDPAGALAHENSFGWYRRGGFLRRLQGGGFTSPFGGPITAGSTFAAHSGLADVGGFRIRALGKKIRHSVGDYDEIMGDHGTVDTLRNRYSLLERMYNRIDDGDLVNEKTGELNTRLWNKKLRDLSGMGIIAQQIEAALRRAQVIAKRTLATYKRLVRQVSRSLAHAGKKDRGGLRTRLKDARDGVTEWGGNVSDLGFDIPNAHLDWRDLGDEFKGMTEGVSTAQQQFKDALAPDTSGDAGSADSGTVDSGTGVPSTADIAAAARQQLDSFQSNLQTLYGGFGRNYIPLGGMGMGGQGGFATPGYFGAGAAGDVNGGTLGNSGGGVYVGQITNVYPTPPEDPHTWSRNLAFELGAMG